MPSIREDLTIPYALADVWPLLADPALVASCIPGATLSPDQSDGLWRGSVKVKFGPTVAVFRGEAKLHFDHTAHRCTIDGRGIDGRGASRALASGVVEASGMRRRTSRSTARSASRDRLRHSPTPAASMSRARCCRSSQAISSRSSRSGMALWHRRRAPRSSLPRRRRPHHHHHLGPPRRPRSAPSASGGSRSNPG